MKLNALFGLLAALVISVVTADSAQAFYHAQMGRFVNRDPIGYRGGDPNLYGYVRGRPTRYVDPMGLRTRPGNVPPTQYPNDHPKPADTPDWWDHYWHGNGAGIDIGDYDGLLDLYKENQSVQDAMEKHNNGLIDASTPDCRGAVDGEVRTKTITFTSVYSVNLRSDIYELGNGRLKATTTCTSTAVCYHAQCTYNDDQRDYSGNPLPPPPAGLVTGAKDLEATCTTTWSFIDY